MELARKSAVESHKDEFIGSGTSPSSACPILDDQSSSSQTAPLPNSTAADILTPAIPAKRKRGKSLSRRTGQDGHIEKSGKWFVVRFWKDIPGEEKRIH